MDTETKEFLTQMARRLESIDDKLAKQREEVMDRLDSIDKKLAKQREEITDLQTDRYWDRHRANAPAPYIPTRPASTQTGRAFHEADRYQADHPYRR